MSHKKVLPTLIVVAVALFAFVPGALAATPEGDPAGGKFPVAATGTSGPVVLSLSGSGLKITCTSGTGSGQATSKTTGEGSATLHGCGENLFGTTCSSSGQPADTVKIETLVSHLVYLDENHTNVGGLATPPASGVFAKLSCGGGLVSIEVKGNGILSRITSPACGQTTKTGTVVSEVSSPGV
jgi:hypothetical protein